MIVFVFVVFVCLFLLLLFGNIFLVILVVSCFGGGGGRVGVFIYFLFFWVGEYCGLCVVIKGVFCCLQPAVCR